ncbi:hypothetical protein [Mycobacterium sp. C31M]
MGLSGVTSPRSLRTKAIEWLRRYLPLEIGGWVGELGSAAVAYAATGSLAVAAIAATLGSSVGYYLPAYVNAVRWIWPSSRRPVLTNLLALRSLTVEFGIAEVVDTALVRPALIFAAPILLDHVLLGWIVGGVLADIVFYTCTIFSYEKFGRWLARRPQPSPTALDPEPALP